jgi:TPR repeat protein
MIRRLLALAFLILAVPAHAADKTFYEGLRAFNSGQFEEAAAIWEPLAGQGDANSESSLALLYYTGFGVQRDFDTARGLFLSAAQQGVVQAQMFLSLMYYKGDGVRRDYKVAYMWSDIAMAAGFDQAADFRSMVAENLTPDETQEAQKLAVEWRSYYVRK